MESLFRKDSDSLVNNWRVELKVFVVKMKFVGPFSIVVTIFEGNREWFQSRKSPEDTQVLFRK